MHSTMSLPPSVSDPHPVTCKIALLHPHAYPHCRQCPMIRYPKSAYSGYPTRPARVDGSLLMIHPCDPRSIFRNPPEELQCGCRSYRAKDLRFVFDISLPMPVHMCMASGYHHRIRKGRDGHNPAKNMRDFWTYFSCSIMGRRFMVKAFTKSCSALICTA